MSTKCLIILGGGLRGNQLNQHTKLRYDKGLAMEKKFDYVICSSGGTYRKEGLQRRISEAEAGKRYLVKNGVSQRKILLEDRSRDTFSNAYYSRKILDKLKITAFTVVTSEFHLKKAKFLFQVVFPAVEYRAKFIKSKNGIISTRALKNRRIHERLVLQFYKKHLFTTYGVKKGDMNSIANFLKRHNLATSGRMDQYQRELTEKINRRLDKKGKLLY